MPSPNFIDTRLTFPVRPIETVGFSFNTLITEKLAGQERRNPVRTEYRVTVEIDTLTLKPCGDTHEIDALISFFKTVNGRKNTFRYRNFYDYFVTAIPVIYRASPGFLSPSVYSLGLLLSGQTYQLLKIYEVGGARTSKTLRLIDATTLEVFVNGSQTFNYTLDNLEGQIEILDSLVGDEEVTFNCEYDLEMRFNMDNFVFNATWSSIKEVTGISLIEELTTTEPFGNESDYTNISVGQFKLPSIPLYTSGSTYAIKLDALANQKEQRELRYTDIASVYTYSPNSPRELDVHFLSSWFIACKGRLLGFEFNDEQLFSRFDTDSLSLTLVQPKTTTNCEQVIRVEQFSILGKEGLLAPPEFPDFFLEPTFVDIGIGFDPENEVPFISPFTQDGVTGSGGGGGSGVGGAAGGGSPGGGVGGAAGGGFGGGGSEPEGGIDIPSTFTPVSVTEISGFPVIFGRVPATPPEVGNIATLAIPNLPWDGTFELVDLGFRVLSAYATKWTYHNNACITIVSLTPKTTDASSVTAFMGILELFSDLSWSITNVLDSTSSTGFSQNMVREWHIKENKIYFRSPFNVNYLSTGNQPVSVTPVFATGTLLQNLNDLPYSRLTNTDRVENAFTVFAGAPPQVQRYINDVPVTEFIFDNANRPSTSSLLDIYGAVDENNNTGFVVTNLQLCDEVIDYNDLGSCTGGNLTNQYAVMEQQGVNGQLIWLGSFEESAINYGASQFGVRTVALFKRALFGTTELLHLPTGLRVTYSALGVPNPNFGLISAGQNFVVSMTLQSEWKLYFMSIL